MKKQLLIFVFCMLYQTTVIEVFGFESISKPTSLMSQKKIFLNELTEARSGNPILSNKNPRNLDILLENMIKDNPTSEPGSTSSLQQYSKGKWDVVYAPHIKTLGKVLLSDFSVFYKFLDINDGKKLGIISNVYYDSRIFGKGWLNTQGQSSTVVNRFSFMLSIVFVGSQTRMSWTSKSFHVVTDTSIFHFRESGQCL